LSGLLDEISRIFARKRPENCSEIRAAARKRMYFVV